MALSTKILGTEAYIELAGRTIYLTDSISKADILGDLGLTNAMHFAGITSTAMEDGRTTPAVTIAGASYTPMPGDVILDNAGCEYVWYSTNADGTAGVWERLGRDTNFKIVQSAVSDPTANGAALAFIDTISQNANGEITVTKKNLDTVPVNKGGTGKTTAREGFHALSAGLTEGTADCTADTVFMCGNTNGATNDWYYRKCSHLYNYIKGAASGTWAISIGGNAATATIASQLGSSNVGAADRPIYLSSGTATQTTYRMAGTNVTATTALAITDNLNTGIWYVNGTNSTNLYSQSDGVAYVNKYSDSWIHEIYGDYRTGQIAVRGKNNGTWQDWRKILDSTNYTNYTVKKDGTGATGTWAINIGGNAATATIANGLVDGTSTMTSAYNKAGLAYADYTWLAGWNGYELRAVNKSQFATASHTHDRIVQAAITIQTGSAALAHINLATLMSWLITTKGYIPSGVQGHKYIPVSWSYAGNDILQFSAYGTNWEIQLAGCIMEFWGTATSSTGAGPFRLVIHTSPTQSYTSASGYQKVPVSSTWEYVCNGSGYSPTWVCLSHPYIIQVNPTNTPTAVGSIWVTT